MIATYCVVDYSYVVCYFPTNEGETQPLYIEMRYNLLYTIELAQVTLVGRILEVHCIDYK